MCLCVFTEEKEEWVTKSKKYTEKSGQGRFPKRKIIGLTGLLRNLEPSSSGKRTENNYRVEQTGLYRGATEGGALWPGQQVSVLRLGAVKGAVCTKA